MSIEAMNTCWDPEFPVVCDGVSKSTVRLVALAIADVVNDAHGFEFYGSTARLAKKADVSRQVALAVISHLVDVGVLVVVERRPGRTNRYRWVSPNLSPQATGFDGDLSPQATPPVTTRDTNPIDTQETTQAGLTTVEAAAPPSSGTRTLSHACPRPGLRRFPGCGAKAGEPCETSTTAKLYRNGAHVSRVARAVVTEWWEAVKERDGRPPAGLAFNAAVGVVWPLLAADHDAWCLVRTMTAMHGEGRTITRQALEARVADRRPPSYAAKPGALGTQGEWDMALAKYGTVDADHPADTRELNR